MRPSRHRSPFTAPTTTGAARCLAHLQRSKWTKEVPVNMMQNHRRAFTITELFVCILIAILIVGILLPAFGQRRPRGGRQIKDGTQVRNIVQACFTFAESNKGVYPLPSTLDIAGLTLPSTTPGVADQNKDTTGNILALLIQGGGISPEICVSPAEASGFIRLDEGYETSRPAGAVNPDAALWDPKFAGTPEQGGNAQSLAPRIPGIGNNSYAHSPAFGGKRARWASTASQTEAAWGNRGPLYQGTTSSVAGWKLVQGAGGTDSVTLAIHGGRNTWEGNIGYNDSHVEFETRPDPTTITYNRARGGAPVTVPDNLFVDETDDVTRNGDTRPDSLAGANQFLAMISRIDNSATVPALKLFKD